MDLNNLVIQEARPLPVIILADCSGSMASDNRINSLNEAMKDMIDSLKDESSLRAEVYLSVVAFGGSVKSHLDFSKASEVVWKDLSAGGATPMGGAFKVTRNLLEDKGKIPSRSYAPTIILLSDGGPTDNWKEELNLLLSSPRASKGHRIAMSINAGEQGKSVLKEFLGDSELPVFEASEAREIKKFFRFVTMSVSQRVQSTNPNQTISISFEDEDDLDNFDF